MDTEDGQVFIRVRATVTGLDKTNIDMATEFGLLCTNSRKGPRQCSAAAATEPQEWPGHHLALVAQWPCQPSLILVLERLGGRAVSTFSNLHFAVDQAREAHTDTPSSFLQPLPI